MNYSHYRLCSYYQITNLTHAIYSSTDIITGYEVSIARTVSVPHNYVSDAALKMQEVRYIPLEGSTDMPPCFFFMPCDLFW